MQSAIRICAIAVRVVGPHHVELAPVRVQTNVVAIVNAVARRRRVRESAAQANVRRKSRTAIGSESAIVFGIVVRNHVGPS